MSGCARASVWFRARCGCRAATGRSRVGARREGVGAIVGAERQGGFAGGIVGSHATGETVVEHGKQFVVKLLPPLHEQQPTGFLVVKAVVVSDFVNDVVVEKVEVCQLVGGVGGNVNVHRVGMAGARVTIVALVKEFMDDEHALLYGPHVEDGEIGHFDLFLLLRLKGGDDGKKHTDQN